MNSFWTLVCAVWIVANCPSAEPLRYQGYWEADYLRLGTALGGHVVKLHVKRGQSVEAGSLLLELEHESESAALEEASQRLAKAEALLENLKKGKRQEELAVIQAQLQQAQAQLRLTEKQWARQRQLSQQKLASQEQFDQIQSQFQRDQARVHELQAQWQTAQLGARNDEIKAAEAEVAGAHSARQQAQWRLAQKTLRTPQAGRVEETLYQVGEWVNAGVPAVIILPPEHLKARFFLPEAVLGQIQPGQTLQITCDGCPSPVKAQIDYIASEVEYTPPVIFSQENRQKLIFLAEAHLLEAPSPGLHPGQPLEVEPMR